MRTYYGIFATVNGTRRFAILTNKRRARKLASNYPGAEIRVASAATFDGGTQYGIDAPTFRVQSDPLTEAK